MLIVRTRGGDPPEKEENGRNARRYIEDFPRLRRTWQENEVDRIKNELNSGYGYISNFSS